MLRTLKAFSGEYSEITVPTNAGPISVKFKPPAPSPAAASSIREKTNVVPIKGPSAISSLSEVPPVFDYKG